MTSSKGFSPKLIFSLFWLVISISLATMWSGVLQQILILWFPTASSCTIRSQMSRTRPRQSLPSLVLFSSRSSSLFPPCLALSVHRDLQMPCFMPSLVSVLDCYPSVSDISCLVFSFFSPAQLHLSVRQHRQIHLKEKGLTMFAHAPCLFWNFGIDILLGGWA